MLGREVSGEGGNAHQLHFLFLGCPVLVAPVDADVVHPGQDPRHPRLAVLALVLHFLPENVSLGPQAVLLPDSSKATKLLTEFPCASFSPQYVSAGKALLLLCYYNVFITVKFYLEPRYLCFITKYLVVPPDTLGSVDKNTVKNEFQN